MIEQLLSSKLILPVNGSRIYLRNFTAEEKSLAEDFSERMYLRAFEEGCFTSEEVSDLITLLGYWSTSKEEEVGALEKNLEQMKVDYLENFIFEQRRSQIRKAIKQTKRKLTELYGERSYLQEYTCESVRVESRLFYLMEQLNTGINPYLLCVKYNKLVPSEEQIRAICKGRYWKLLWNASKEPESLFSCKASDLSDVQLTLLFWARIYDSIRESMEPPSPEVIEDDYALDGWFIKQHRKRDSEEKKDTKPGEYFVPVRNKQEQEAVYRMNSPESKQSIKSLKNDLLTKKEVDDANLTQVRQDIILASNKASFRK